MDDLEVFLGVFEVCNGAGGSLREVVRVQRRGWVSHHFILSSKPAQGAFKEAIQYLKVLVVKSEQSGVKCVTCCHKDRQGESQNDQWHISHEWPGQEKFGGVKSLSREAEVMWASGDETQGFQGHLREPRPWLFTVL